MSLQRFHGCDQTHGSLVLFAQQLFSTDPKTLQKRVGKLKIVQLNPPGTQPSPHQHWYPGHHEEACGWSEYPHWLGSWTILQTAQFWVFGMLSQVSHIVLSRECHKSLTKDLCNVNNSLLWPHTLFLSLPLPPQHWFHASHPPDMWLQFLPSHTLVLVVSRNQIEGHAETGKRSEVDAKS